MPKIVDHDQKRKELLQGSFALFAQRGYSSVTMREIAKELHVSTGTLYHYFPNKDKLFEQLISMMVEQDAFAAIKHIGNEDNIIDKLESLIQFVQKHEQHFRHLLLLALEFSKHSKQPESKQIIAINLKRFSEAIQESLELQHTHMGSIVLSTLIGIVYQRTVSEETTSFQAAVGILSDIAAQRIVLHDQIG